MNGDSERTVNVKASINGRELSPEPRDESAGRTVQRQRWLEDVVRSALSAPSAAMDQVNKTVSDQVQYSRRDRREPSIAPSLPPPQRKTSPASRPRNRNRVRTSEKGQAKHYEHVRPSGQVRDCARFAEHGRGGPRHASGPTTTNGEAKLNRPTGSPSSGESGDQEEGASEGISISKKVLRIIVALAMSINFAADFQKGNENVVETDQASA